MIRVGLVEDNADFRAEVAFHLRRAGLAVVLESDGGDLDAQLARHPCDLLVLDLGLPAEDGLSIATRLRHRQPGLGIVMLTAWSELSDRLTGLAQGADAYLVKPVDMRELVAVLLSLHRRLATPPASAPGTWRLVPATLELRSPQGTAVSLTVIELALLRQLATVAPEPVPRRALAAAIGHPELDFDDRRLEVHFSRLRRKLDTAFAEQDLIRAARGRGYLFAAPLRVDGD